MLVSSSVVNLTNCTPELQQTPDLSKWTPQPKTQLSTSYFLLFIDTNGTLDLMYV